MEQKLEGDAIEALTSKLCHNSVSSVTYATLLRHYGCDRALSKGHILHACLVFHSAHEAQSPFLANWVLFMYGKCGAVADAVSTFCHIATTDIFSWNLFLGVCAENAKHDDAMHAFNQMQIEGFFPNKHTFLSILSLCASQLLLWEGRAAHARILGNGSVSDIVLESALVNTYGKCERVDDARKVFDGMSERNVISWNAMMVAYSQQGQTTNALLLFEDMLLKGVAPSSVTYVSLLDACTSLASSDLAKLMHWCVVWEGFESDIVVGTTLINLYGVCGELDEARHIFCRLPGKSVATWNAMIEVSASQGEGEDAFHLFKEMCVAHVTPNNSTFVSVLSACAKRENLMEGKYVHSCIIRSGIISDAVLDTALVTMYGKCGSLMDARAVYDAMNVHDVIAWTSMMAAYTQYEQSKEALLLVQNMPSGALLDIVTCASILDACAAEGASEEGRMMHVFVVDGEFVSNVVVGTALVDMYSKCGKLEDARGAFEAMPEKDVVAWNAMIAAYTHHGQLEVAAQVLHQMQKQGFVPNGVTLLCTLTAFSHGGFVSEAEHCICSMESLYDTIPTVDHYNCMLDLFGRSGWISEGEKLILYMPYQPNATSWMTLVGACRMHLSVNGGECAVPYLLEIDPEFGAPLVVLSNLYAVTGEMWKAERLRKWMKGENFGNAASLRHNGG